MKKMINLKQNMNEIVLSVAAIVLSLILASLIMVMSGYPIVAYSAMLEGAFGSTNAIANTLAKTTPLLLVGLACAFANKGGIFNIGGEGQLYMGAFCAAVLALSMQGMPRLVVIFVCLLIGAIAGGMVHLMAF